MSVDFYPGSMEAKALWHANLAKNLPSFAAKYNITPQQLAAVAADNEWMQFWVTTRHRAATFASQLAAYFNSLSGNDPSLDPPLTPDFSVGAAPPEVPAGIEFRGREIARHIKGHSSYAEADGTLLMVIGEGSGGAQGIGRAIVPDIQAKASNSGYQFTIVVTNRRSADAWQVWATVVGENKWQNIATATGKSATVTYEPLDKDNRQPYQLQVRVQLRRNNQNFGTTSAISPVTVNP